MRVRFYADLIDLAGTAELEVPFGEPRSVKDLIESQGVPHPEIGLILVDDRPVGFDHRVQAGQRIAVYPPFRSIDLTGVTTVRPPAPEPRFVLDVHLGTLARRLRLLGFDCWYRNDADDDELAQVAVDEDRILLTRDRELLMRRAVVHGYCPRSDDPELQAIEVVRRYELASRAAPFTRCIRCNGALEPVAKADVLEELPPRTRVEHDRFARCTDCGQVYWPGSHVDAVAPFLTDVGSTDDRSGRTLGDEPPPPAG